MAQNGCRQAPAPACRVAMLVRDLTVLRHVEAKYSWSIGKSQNKDGLWSCSGYIKLFCEKIRTCDLCYGNCFSHII